MPRASELAARGQPHSDRPKGRVIETEIAAALEKFRAKIQRKLPPFFEYFSRLLAIARSSSDK